MSEQRGDETRPGLELQKHAMELLSAQYGEISFEKRIKGKKADLYFERNDYGNVQRVYLEVKDLNHALTRKELVHILTDYEYVVKREPSSILLLISRNGLTADAQKYISDEAATVRHQTIWRLEDQILGLKDYLSHLRGLFDEDDLSTYYVETRAIRHVYPTFGSRMREPNGGSTYLYTTVSDWLQGDVSKPLAILAGYGAGKSSFAKRVAAQQAKLALADPTVRKPILIKLGDFTGHSRLEGVLGAMFTYEFPVPHFNVHRFFDLNRRGRFLLILDGFDEMKHAMTWTDFRAQLAELNKLISGHSRVMLLGRPSAFLSNEEHIYALRGRKPSGRNGWQRIADWPEFDEYDIQEFSSSERMKFIRGYLKHATRKTRSSASESWVEERTEQLIAIAESEKAVFSKPVHVKILADLAVDSDADISAIGGRTSRWGLYELFFSSLADREARKAARSPIGEEYRIEFLRSVARWLWIEKGGATSFSASAIPEEIIQGLPDGDAEDRETKKREYLTGSFLEKKSTETYYFPHRSMVEFLVADSCIKSPPITGQLKQLELLTEGVRAFLLESPYLADIASWAKDLPRLTHLPGLDYLEFLRRACGGTKPLIRKINPKSPWRGLVSSFPKEISLRTASNNRMQRQIEGADDETAILVLKLFFLRNFSSALRWTSSKPEERSEALAVAILNRLFFTVKKYVNNVFYFPIANKHTALLMAGAVKKSKEAISEADITIDWSMIWERCDTCLSNIGIDFSMELRVTPPPPTTLKAVDVLNRIDPDYREIATIFWQRYEVIEEGLVHSPLAGAFLN